MSSQAFALDLSDRFTARTMERERQAILYAIKSFHALDPMIDRDDLWQESWFGVNNAHHRWDDARAINMQFKNFLIWHIKRHLQGAFLGSDKIVELFDKTTQRVVVSIPYSRFKKEGRRIAKERNYGSRIRSLLVYYDQPDEDGQTRVSIPADPHHFTHACDIAEANDTQVVDLYTPAGELVITIPMRTYYKKQDLIQQQGLVSQSWCIYDPRPSFTRPQSCTVSPKPIRRRDLASAHAGRDLMVDIYSRRGEILVRMNPDTYKVNRKHFEHQGCLIRFHDPRQYPEQPPFEDIEAQDRRIKSIRQLPTHANSTNAY
jgi:hypothetical protein